MLPHNYNTCRFVTTDRLTLWYTTMGVIMHKEVFFFAEMKNYATYKGPCEEHLLAVMSLASAR